LDSQASSDDYFGFLEPESASRLLAVVITLGALISLFEPVRQKPQCPAQFAILIHAARFKHCGCAWRMKIDLGAQHPTFVSLAAHGSPP
jgi:hypothetical protein